MKKLRIAVVVVIAILALGLGAIWLLVDPNDHREFIQAELEKQLGRKVSLGQMSLGLLPLRFQVADTVIAEDPNLGQKTPFVRADTVALRIGLLSLLWGNVSVDSLELLRPSVELIKTKSGSWNFATLGPGTGATPSTPTTAPPAPATGFALNRLTIVDGQIGITDLQLNRPRIGYDHIDLTLLDLAAGKPFSFDLAAHIQGEGAQEVRLKGNGGPISSANPAETPFRGTLTLNEVGIDGLLKFLDTKALPKAMGTLTGESEVASQSGSLTSSGKLTLDRARFNDLDIGYPIGLDYKLGAKVAEGLITIENATLQLGPTPLSIAGSVRTAATPPVLDLRIKSGDASISEIARLASAFGVAFAPGTTVNGRVSADVHAKGPTTKPALTGTIAGRDLQVSGKNIPQPVQVKAVDLALSPTAIQSNEFNATSGKTTVVGRFSLFQYASDAPSIDLGLRTPGATLPEIQSIAKAYGVAGLDQVTGEGTLDFDLRAKGPLKSVSSADAARALNGTINLNFSPLKIAGFDAAHELAKIGGFASSMTDQGATDIGRVIGKIIVKNGVAQSDNLQAQLGIGNLAGSGSADLATETLDMKLSAVFTKAFSDKVGATRAGGYLSTALSNSAGELVIPALVTGTFKQPRFAPDLKAVAQMQKQRFLPSLDNPAAALSNALGALKGKPQEGTDKPAQQEQPSPVKGILDLFGGKKTESKE
jgi:uncharacterized protein involved in outer membrane biogenesis